MEYYLPELKYGYADLEPHIDAKTMEIHLTRHHQTYIDKLNAVLKKYPELAEKSLEELLKNLKSLKMEEADRTLLRNNGGGHINHLLYWQNMGPHKEIDEQLTDQISSTFGSVELFKEKLTAAALGQFGSGWAWLTKNEKQELEILATPNQDSPWLVGKTPILGLDVWEHAYYLKYQNKRADYIAAWWNIVRII